MLGPHSTRQPGMLLLTILAALIPATVPVAPVRAADSDRQIVVIPPGSAYRQRNLVSDIPGMALIQHPLLVNPWGMAMTASSQFWLANDGTSTATRYRGDVAGSPLVPDAGRITIPGGLPTGMVANTSADFVVSSGSASGPARFIFASITGNISGWNPNVPAGSSTAQIAASHPGHVYTGLASGNNGANLLYAADFANGAIDVYNASYALTTVSGGFADGTIPAGFHPFNIQNIGGLLYVTYAKLGADGRDEEGVGNGYVRRFDTNGLRDLTFGMDAGELNSPWGLALAPSSFGLFGGALLVGNVGDGNPSIHAFNPSTGAFLGTLQNESGVGIKIDELQALSFGNGASAGSPNTLYFTAGTGEQEHGLFGSLSPTTASAVSTVQLSDSSYAILENYTKIQVTVTRKGDASGSASVRYTTWDQSQARHASQKSDYELNAGLLTFGPGETSKTFAVYLVNDRFVEGSETIDLALSNPGGAGVGLGSPNVATIRILDNDSTPTSSNPIDGTTFFVRQQYLDLLTRAVTASELTDKSTFIDACGSNTTCRRSRRNSVSADILLSAESVDSVGLIYRLHRAAFATAPLYGEVVLSAQIRRALGVSRMTSTFMSNPRFVAKYASLSNSAYVNTLAANSGYGFSSAQKNAWITALNNGSRTRAAVLLELARDPGYRALVRNRWIVLAGYWGYLRRDPDQAGFNARLQQLTAGGGDPLTSGLINGFLTSSEFRQRFGTS